MSGRPVVLNGVRPLGGRATRIAVAGERIVDPADVTSTRRVDCDGLVLLPAFVDLHTHLREPGGEDAETIASGTRAAAAGGYSDVFAMANCSPVTDSPERVRFIAATAAKTAACRVHPVGAVTVGLLGRTLTPIAELARAGVRMISDDGRCIDDAALLRSALRQAAAAGIVVAQHAQCGKLAADGQINAGPVADATGLSPWPAVAEETIVARDVVLAGETGARLHVCHVSTAGTVDVLRWAKRQGWPVTAEVTPHHLMLSDAHAATADPRYKVNPPLRGSDDVAALREGLRDGTIDAVATDHAPHPRHRKETCWREAAFGFTGLETALAVVADVLADGGEPDWPLLADRMSWRPAAIGGLTGQTAVRLGPGAPATFTLVETGTEWTVTQATTVSRSVNTPFTSSVFRHRVVATVVEGMITAAKLPCPGQSTVSNTPTT